MLVFLLGIRTVVKIDFICASRNICCRLTYKQVVWHTVVCIHSLVWMENWGHNTLVSYIKIIYVYNFCAATCTWSKRLGEASVGKWMWLNANLDNSAVEERCEGSVTSFKIWTPFYAPSFSRPRKKTTHDSFSKWSFFSFW